MSTNNAEKVIAIDLMGGDASPSERLHAVKKFAKQNSDIQIKLFVTAQFYQDNPFLASQSEKLGIHVIQTPQQVSMDDAPLHALKHKKDSSLSLAIKSVADGAADAVLTAGNTAVMVVLAKKWLNATTDIERPALATVLPGFPKNTLLLDVGATLDYRADDLFNLARLGSSAAKRLLASCKNPEVALLNVGTEYTKGSDTVRQADRLLQESELNYLGFCEGNHLFEGYADVVVCDGFVGNTTLKACEGLMQLMSQSSKRLGENKLRSGFKNILASISGLNFSPSQYNGALLLGLDGCVMKSHGNSDRAGFLAALERTKAYIIKRPLHKSGSL